MNNLKWMSVYKRTLVIIDGVNIMRAYCGKQRVKKYQRQTMIKADNKEYSFVCVNCKQLERVCIDRIAVRFLILINKIFGIYKSNF